jgi:tetraacyldisaccharide 4'-kinase
MPGPRARPGTRAALIAGLERRWYGGEAPEWWLRLIASWYGANARRRRAQYLAGLGVEKSRLPVVVVGNLTIGGTGKTPLVLSVVEGLRARGWRPGIVSRGYGGRSRGARLVSPHSDAAMVGDEPLLLARRSGVPVAVARKRIDAVRLLESGGQVDLLVADDGLQHYGMGRDVEVVVIDGLRRHGNGRLLPAGPLREPLERGAAADFRVVNGGFPEPGEIRMHLELDDAVSLDGRESRPLSDFAGTRVHAVAGIGHPERFFKSLRDAGLDIEPHPFPDHHPFTGDDLQFGDAAPILMTEKDAVKCRTFSPRNRWYVPARAHLPESFLDALHRKLAR